MKKSDKIAVWSVVEFDSRAMPFALRNLILLDVARALGFAMFHDHGKFELVRRNRFGTTFGKPILCRPV